MRDKYWTARILSSSRRESVASGNDRIGSTTYVELSEGGGQVALIESESEQEGVAEGWIVTQPSGRIDVSLVVNRDSKLDPVFHRLKLG